MHKVATASDVDLTMGKKTGCDERVCEMRGCDERVCYERMY